MRFLLIGLLLFSTINLYANCNGKFFSFKVKSTKKTPVKIINILENLSDECRLNLVFEDSNTKKAIDKTINYINIHDFSLGELLELLLSDNNIFYSLDQSGKILKIASHKTKTFYIDYVSFQQRTSSSTKIIKTGSKGNKGSGSTTLNFKSDFQFWHKIEEELNSILHDSSESPPKIIFNQEAGTATVTGNKRQLDKVEKYINTITKRLHKQVLLDAKIIEVTYSNTNNQGIDWSKFEASLEGSLDGLKDATTSSLTSPTKLFKYNFSMEGLMKFLQTQGDVNVISNPKILTLNNQPAAINVGEEKNYKYTTGETSTTTNGVIKTTPQYTVGSTFVGVTLDIVPEVTKDDFIILKINPTISEISESHLNKDGIPSLAPDIKIKQLSSIVKVKNGKKILIGGLIQQKIEDKMTKVPLLNVIPILGRAFKSNTKVKIKSELIIVITPTLISGELNNISLDEFERKFN